MEKVIAKFEKEAVSAKRKFDQMEGELENIKVLYRDVIDKAKGVIKKKKDFENIDYGLGKRKINQSDRPCEKVNVLKKLEKPFTDLAEKVLTLQSANALCSNILTVQQTKDLICLINMPISTKWTLIYWASRDGFGANDFHYYCDNKPNTLTIIKAENGDVFGGFTEAEWDTSGKFKKDRNAFLFVLIRKNNTSAKLPIGNDEDDDSDGDDDDNDESDYESDDDMDNESDDNASDDEDNDDDYTKAIQCRKNCGPVFGPDELCIADDSNSNEDSKAQRLYVYSGGNLSSLTDSEEFKVEDIEVFQKI